MTIAWKEPKTAIGCVVRVINTAPQFGFLVFLPIYFTETVGFSLPQWLRLLSLIFLSNIIWNLLFGIIGDRLGWRRTVAFCGGRGLGRSARSCSTTRRTCSGRISRWSPWPASCTARPSPATCRSRP